MNKKFAYGVLALTALALASSVSAQTSIESIINSLTTTQTTTTSSSMVFTRDLDVNSTGADVTALQNWLIGKGFSIPAGATGFFGAQTKAAVAAYQTANGIAPAAGYFGPKTRASVNAMAVGGTPVTPTTPVVCPVGFTCTSTTGGSTTSGPLSGGAGDITVSERSSGVQDEILEGEEDVKVLGFEVEADGSDIEVTSARVEFEHDGSGSDRLDRYVDSVSIMMGDKVVGTADVDDFNESSDVYSHNIAISGAVVDEDDTERLYVVVTGTNNIDSTDLSEDWEVALGQIRFEDATGAILTDNTGTGVNGSISETFTFEDLSSSGDIELTISEDDEDINETHSIGVDDSSDTNDVEILSFTLAAEGSDIFPDTISFGVTSNSGTGVTEIANDFRLMQGDEEVGTVAIDRGCDGGSDGFASTTDEAICVTVSDLDDDDVAIDADDEVGFTLVADINDVDGGFSSGDDLSVTLNGDVTVSSNGSITADDENGDALTISELSGSADSTTIEFLSTGISVTTIEVDQDTDEVVSTTATDDKGIYSIIFDVTAIEDAAYIELGAATRGTTETNTGTNFVIQDEPNSYAATTTGSIALSELKRVSGGTVSGEFVKINAGSTARFELEVTFDPGHVTGSSVGYRMRLYSVNSAATAVDATAQQVLTPEVDYRTGAVTIGN